MIKVSDFIAQELVKLGVKHIFMISGGGAMHLNDSLGKHSGLEYICNHHEQASAIAAEGYARVGQKLAVVNVTTGPGGVNALNGVFGQWSDSVPALYISGQVKFETTMQSCPELKLRQLGDQEVDIISMVKPITKYAKMLTDPNEVKKVLYEAIEATTSGRPGPAWIDIPINVQGALIDEKKLTPFESKKNPQPEISSEIKQLFEMLKSHERPVIVAGHGITISSSKKDFLEFAQKLQVPVLGTFNGFDVLEDEHPQFIGRIGTIGQRAGNFALQNADLILFLGTRNNIRQVSYNWQMFGRDAKKIAVDIDCEELKKPTLQLDLAICADLKDFFKAAKKHDEKLPDFHAWLDWCKERKEKFNPQKNPEYLKKGELINPYQFILELTKTLPEKSVMVAGNGTACVSLFQAGLVKKDQRIFWNSGNASMGYDLPAAIGACFANDKKDVICLAGDGSIMMNLQELQTVKHYNLPLKIFVLNNSGYSSIRQTQKNFFGEKFVACSENSGVSVPDFTRIATAFGIPAFSIRDDKNLAEQISEIITRPGPLLCEVMLEHDYIFQPKLSSEKLPDGRMISKPLEDMYPFLDREEFAQNMIKKL